MDVFQTAERLVDEGLEVRVRERLAGADLSVYVMLCYVITEKVFAFRRLLRSAVRMKDGK